MKILVIEDNEAVRELISQVLSGNEITAVGSLAQGLAGLENKPDLVITDWKLGGDTNSADIINNCIENKIRVVVQTANPYSSGLDEIRAKGVEVIYKNDLRFEIKRNLENMGKPSVER